MRQTQFVSMPTMTATPSEPDADRESADAPTIGYGDAMTELEGILARLEDDQLDIDQLADLVARGADLMALCRDRLDAAKLRVTEIVADLDAAD